jgi:FMN phosphatase YigB (HAD superfamily)
MAPVVVFDVDGVLVDTHELVRKAYAEIGVVIPKGRWGSAWPTWLPDQCGGDLDRARDLHDRKTRIHLDLLTSTTVRPLAGAEAADWLATHGWTVRVLTSSTKEVARATLDSIRSGWSSLLAATDVDHLGKRRILHDLAPSGVYVDDNLELGEKITDSSAWRLVHFDGQALPELMTEVEATWKP